ncbi:M28 family metallopeptidase [Nocardioides bigeumensis]|uniref:M28 family metallopeptidase n=1 Tax=Nocardioides bigeumensis TaxID=433657 RepID=UPI0031E1FDA7
MSRGVLTCGRAAASALSMLLLAACTADGEPAEVAAGDPGATAPNSGSATARAEPVEPSPPDASPSHASPPVPEPSAPRVVPGDLRVGRAVRAVQHLAGQIGPRHGTSPAYQQAVRWVSRELRALGYDVRRQGFDAPAGVSWGVPVDAGRSANVIATLPGARSTDRHLVVGAHLDTVPQAPGAEDNASGIGVMLAVAAASAERRTRLPVTFVAFGAEEPRGPGDAHHHYGSRAYVASLGPAERRAVAGMVSLDRVGVGSVVPVGSADLDGRDPRQHAVIDAARRARVPVVATYNRSSDHWSFARAGMPGVRLGSTSYAAYHSAQDVASVVRPAQLERVGRLVLAWLR